jgi:hypothetical protein
MGGKGQGREGIICLEVGATGWGGTWHIAPEGLKRRSGIKYEQGRGGEGLGLSLGLGLVLVRA